MTRGRPPKKAAAEALLCARFRGGVVKIPDTSGLPFDLIIISLSYFAFVKVMRMRSRIQSPMDALFQFGSVIRALRIVPESAVAVIELWVLSSHKTWQYFRIMPDRIIEIRSDGSTIDGIGQNTGVYSDVPPDHTGVPDPESFHLRASSPGNAVPAVSRTRNETL